MIILQKLNSGKIDSKMGYHYHTTLYMKGMDKTDAQKRYVDRKSDLQNHNSREYNAFI